jgi:hypothetical protein
MVHAIIGHLFRVVTLLVLALNWITGEIINISYDICTASISSDRVKKSAQVAPYADPQ